LLAVVRDRRTYLARLPQTPTTTVALRSTAPSTTTSMSMPSLGLRRLAATPPTRTRQPLYMQADAQFVLRQVLSAVYGAWPPGCAVPHWFAQACVVQLFVCRHWRYAVHAVLFEQVEACEQHELSRHVSHAATPVCSVPQLPAGGGFVPPPPEPPAAHCVLQLDEMQVCSAWSVATPLWF